MMGQIREMLTALRATARDMSPILAILAAFQLLVVGAPPETPGALLLGLASALVGLMLFVRGLELSLFPLGEALTDAIVRTGRPFWLLLFAFALGFGTTAAEPALAAVAGEAALAMVGDPAFPAAEAQLAALTAQIRYGVSVGLGLALTLGVWRILKGWPLMWFVLPGYGVVALVALVSDAPFVAVALDAGVAATSAINVPLMLALGIGLAGVLRSRNPLVDGFGLVVLASLAPMLLFLSAAFLLVGGV
ncbi:MAG: DUF1538 domain-containing protein [Rhodobacteraceae bacterium]|nr:MAG: DUF1538 domain-containing protein [Paracoccaceae bacterium]